jgi:hypothetical protein
MADSTGSLSNKSILLVLLIFASTILLIAFFIIVLDPGAAENPAGYHLTDPSLAEGRKLAEFYCSSCHKFPEPDLLPKSTWETETLPAMAPLLGITQHENIYYSSILNRSQLQYLPPDYYPDEPVLSSEEWQKVLDYYTGVAPDFLSPSIRDPEIIRDSLFFASHLPNFISDRPPIVTSIKFDRDYRRIYVSNASENAFMIFDDQLELVKRLPINSPIANIEFIGESENSASRTLLFTYIGHLDPSDAPLGSAALGWYKPESDDADMNSDLLLDNLTRPVESKFADLNGNGKLDLLVAEFGNHTGKFSWFENQDDSYSDNPNILVDAPGCMQSYVMDFTGNGLNDIIVLCAQVDQSIYLFENLGDANFNKKTLLEFNITAGSSSFELIDINGNGHLDILYTSGDNADYSKVFKPYHGVYIFINDGNFNFTEEWFYPVNGAYRAITSDFNNNGHLDIAVISYFADYYRSPEEGFLLFLNSGELNFTPYHHPAASAGRWLTMDIADFTGNGFDDILLGNFPYGPSPPDHLSQRRWEETPLFLLLENQADLIQ